VIAERVAHRIVVFSGKGGVGKTTVAVNLACLLAQRTMRVGLLDADITGPNVLQMMGIDDPPRHDANGLLPHERHGVQTVSLASLVAPEAAVIWRGPMRSKAIQQLLDETSWGDLDLLIVDLPPGTGDEALTIAQETSPQLALIVTTPQEVALLDARRAITFARKHEIPTIGIVENMSGFVCPSCGSEIDLFGTDGGLMEARRQSVLFLGAVPIDPTARESGDSGQPTTLAHPETAASKAFEQIATAIVKTLGPAEADSQE